MQQKIQTQNMIKSEFQQIQKILILQRKLKQQFILKETEATQKYKLFNMVQDQTKKYYASQIQNIQKGKAKIIQDQGFGNSYNFVKEVLLLICNQPKILIILLEKAQPEEDMLKLIGPFTNILYQNLVEGEQYYKDITLIIIQVLTQFVQKKDRNFLKQKLIQQYLKRPQIIRYGKKISRNILIKISQDQTYFPIPPIKTELKKMSSKGDYEGLFYNYDIKKSLRSEGNSLASKQIIQKIKYCIKSQSIYFSDKKLSQKSQQTDEVNEQKKIIGIIQNYLKQIFTTVYNIPVGLRAICKSLQINLKKTELKKDAIYATIWKFMFRIYYDNLKFSQSFLKSRFGNGNGIFLLQKVKNIFLNLEQIQSQNQYFQKQIYKFIDQIIAIPQQNKPQIQKSRLKSYVSCLSFEQIKILFNLIIKIPQIKQVNPKILNRIQRIYEMSQQFQIFKQCKTSKKVYSSNQAFALFQSLSLPQSLQLDYHKLYQQTYKNNKLKNILRQILVTLQPLQQYLIGYKVKSFISLLKKLELKYAKDQQYKGTDKIPIVVKIKYFLWLAKQQQMQNVCNEMLVEFDQRFRNTIQIYKDTKILFLRALQNLKYYRDRSEQINLNMKYNNLKQIAKNFLNAIKFSYCITSPKTREKQFGTNGKLVIPNFQKLIIQQPLSCIHTKGLQVKNYLNTPSHVTTIVEMIQSFCALDQVRASIVTGEDKIKINQNLFLFINFIIQKSQQQPLLKANNNWFKQYLEDLISRKIYNLIFPRSQTYKDLSLYSRFQTLDWICPHHLKISPKNRIQQVWQLTTKCIKDMEKSNSTNEKFENIKQFMKIINGVLFVNDEGGVVDNVYPMIVYTILRAKPEQIYSNLNFIEIFTDPSKMLSSEGYCFTNLKSSILYLQNLNQNHLVGISKQEYEKKIYEKQLNLSIPFLRRSKSTEYATMADLRQKINANFYK